MKPALPTSQSLQTFSNYVDSRCADDEDRRDAYRWNFRQVEGRACAFYSHPNLTVPTADCSAELSARAAQVQTDQPCYLQDAAKCKLDAESDEAVVEQQPAGVTHLPSGKHLLKIALKKELYHGSGCVERGSDTAAKRWINKAVNTFFKTADLDGVGTERSVDRASPLLSEFTQSEAGAWLHRKAVARNLVQLESFVRKAGVNINHQCPKEGNTPLMTAVLHNRWEIAGSLLKAGASATVKNYHGNHLVAMLFQKWFEEKLPAAVHIDLIINMLTTQSRHQIAKRDLLEPLGEYTFTMSAYCGNVRLCKAILQKFPGLARDFRGNRVIDRTLMNVVNGSTHISSVPALLRVIRYLLTVADEQGKRLVDMSTTTPKGETFLIRAVLKGKYSIVEELLDDPAVRSTINAQTNSVQKWTAYTYAHQKKKSDIMRLLVRHGADKCKVPKSSSANTQEVNRRGVRNFICYS